MGSGGLLCFLRGGFGTVAVKEAGLGHGAEQRADDLADDDGADNGRLHSAGATVAHGQEGGYAQGQAEPEPGQVGNPAG